jgi:putative effector of murein hydrolase LrgA (UPF0299 family)
MIAGFCRIFFCLAVGEILSLSCSGMISAAVFGFILLFLDLVRIGHVPETLGNIADRLIQSFGLFFVPAGIGVLAYKDQIRADGFAIALAVLAGTLVTIGATAITAALIATLGKKPGKASEWKASQRPQS